MPQPPDTGLVLGPILRRIDGDQATIWVQTARPATVEVRAGKAGGASRTFSAFGRHYALVVVEGLRPGTSTEYEVLLDGRRAWPEPDSRFPPSVIRTRSPDEPVRLLFGSCRQATPYVTKRYPPDALDAYAARLAAALRAGQAGNQWPDALLLLGDQVYADETSPAIRRWLRSRRRRRRPDAPAEQVVGFDEYTHLYLESWTDPEMRWLFSTVPSLMIFDDHEIIDDWNTSASWRADMAAQPWWAQRITAGLSSYWVYQHMGNLSADQLGKDPVYREVRAADDATEVLAAFGTRADTDRGWYRWSYCMDVGRTRLVMLDTRAGRELEPQSRRIVPAQTWQWFADSLPGEYDHLVVGSSLPWLMAPALHHVEAANERLCDARTPWVARAAEGIRRGLDLEHWAAFGRSFDELGALLSQVGAVDDAPATITVLSGDVHHSYVARARLGAEVRSAVHQVTCSPVHNQLPWILKPAVRVGWSRGAAAAARAAAKLIGTPRPSIGWNRVAGPHYGNAVGVLTHHGATAHARIEATTEDRRLVTVTSVPLG
jgi:hypothetical protein